MGAELQRIQRPQESVPRPAAKHYPLCWRPVRLERRTVRIHQPAAVEVAVRPDRVVELQIQVPVTHRVV